MWTFGICYSSNQYLHQIISSIKNQNTLDNDQFEIILIGPSDINVTELYKKYKKKINIKHIMFEESIRAGWITLKKNLIVQNAQFENIYIAHDYVALCENWITGFDKFGYDWDVCMTPVRLDDGRRHRDWFTQHRPLEFTNYNDNTKTKQMYINGTYWCGKKQFMLENPQNNNLTWGMGEDLEWADRCQTKWNYRLNPYSVVKYLKSKPESDLTPHPDDDPNKNEGYELCKIQE